MKCFDEIICPLCKGLGIVLKFKERKEKEVPK